MTSPDRPRGAEALTMLPFRDVVIPKKDAFQNLTQRTLHVVQKNCASIYTWASLLPESMRDEPRLGIYRVGMENPSRISRAGGLYFDERMIDSLYGPQGPSTFPNLITEIQALLIRSHEEPTLPMPTLPGVDSMKSMLDVLHILDPKIASFDNGVEVILKSFRLQNTTDEGIFQGGAILGWMIDDTVNLRAVNPTGRDIFADSEGAKRFLDTALRIGMPAEKAGIQQGIKEAQEAARKGLTE